MWIFVLGFFIFLIGFALLVGGLSVHFSSMPRIWTHGQIAAISIGSLLLLIGIVVMIYGGIVASRPTLLDRCSNTRYLCENFKNGNFLIYTPKGVEDFYRNLSEDDATGCCGFANKAQAIQSVCQYTENPGFLELRQNNPDSIFNQVCPSISSED